VKLLFLALLSLAFTFTPGPSNLELLYEYTGGVCQVIREDGGMGSGVAFKRVGEDTYVLTAKHVVEGQEKNRFRLKYSRCDTWLEEIAWVFRVSDTDDLAILKVEKSFLKILPVAQPSWHPTEPAGFVFAMGFPGGTFPCWTTLGRIRAIGQLESVFTCNGYFGNSGGPVIDLDTLAVVGIVVHGEIRGESMPASPMYAVSHIAIRKFIPED